MKPTREEKVINIKELIDKIKRDYEQVALDAFKAGFEKGIKTQQTMIPFGKCPLCLAKLSVHTNKQNSKTTWEFACHDDDKGEELVYPIPNEGVPIKALRLLARIILRGEGSTLNLQEEQDNIYMNCWRFEKHGN